MGVLRFWLICPLLALAMAILGIAVRAGAGITEDEIGPSLLSNIPFAVACCLAAVALFAINEDIARNRRLSDDEKKRWRVRFVAFYPLAAWRYWQEERGRSDSQS
jgi:hypothetical protein